MNRTHIKITYLLTAPEPARGKCFDAVALVLWPLKKLAAQQIPNIHFWVTRHCLKWLWKTRPRKRRPKWVAVVVVLLAVMVVVAEAAAAAAAVVVWYRESVPWGGSRRRAAVSSSWAAWSTPDNCDSDCTWSLPSCRDAPAAWTYHTHVWTQCDDVSHNKHISHRQ